MVSARIARTLGGAVISLTILFTLVFLYPTSLDPWPSSPLGDIPTHNVAGDSIKKPLGDTMYDAPSPEVLQGGVIMPKLENATAKALLGQATWKLLHTMTLRFPEHPTPDERTALKSYMYLTSRLYPCGECATEFQQLLADYPPQTSSRKTASLWLCHVHNLVNHRLEKPEYDCNKLDETYDCGCGPEPSPSSTSTLDASVDKVRGEPVMEDEETGLDMIRGGIGRRGLDAIGPRLP